MGGGWKQDECRRGLTFDDDVYQRIDMNPFLLSPRPGSQLCPLFLRPGGGHKGKRNKRFCFPLPRAGGWCEGERNNGAGEVGEGVQRTDGGRVSGFNGVSLDWLWRAWQWSVRLTVSPWLW